MIHERHFMNTKNNQRSRITRLLIKEAYMKLLKDTPLSKITVKSICQLAEINRSTFYLHYNEPDDVLSELEEETITEITSSLTHIGESHNDDVDTKHYLIDALKYLKKSDELLRPLILENSDPHFTERVLGITAQMINNSFNLEGSGKEKNYVFTYITGGSLAILETWMRSGYALTEVQICELIYSMSSSVLLVIENHFPSSSSFLA